MKKIGIVLSCLTIFSVLALIVLPVGAAKRPVTVPTDQIEMGIFVDYGYNSPPWYPPEEETDSYRWAPKLRWAAEDPLVNCMVYTKYAPSGAFDAVMPAFEQWDKNTSAGLYGTVSENSVDDPPGEFRGDGNTMSWMKIDGPGGIIGVCYYWYYANTKELVEFDIVFDKDENWLGTDDEETVPTSAQFDVWNIATHELGHTLVLSDLRSPKDGALTMHAYTWTGDTVKRTLGLGDILGIQAIYGE